MWSSAWYWCNVTALVVCLLAQVKRPTQSLWYAASVVASLCQSHVSVMHGQMAESQPESACQTLAIHHTPASLSARLMEGRREQVFVRKTNERANAANLKDKIYEIHPTVSLFAQSESCQTPNKVKERLHCLAGFVLYLERCVTNKIWKPSFFPFLTALFLCLNWLLQ